MKKEKIQIKVLIEGDKAFNDDYNQNQKIKVLINKSLANLKIDSDGRELKREDGTPILDWDKTIEEINISAGECLRFFKKAPKPDRDKGFA
ncbi:hypothetical protein JM83_1047 [Gillisia sp. Hel_I_86]|uniref:DUF2604 domain-containing protein n=1 Tax=Gillisia sp. Hel_I_86 TaxID=1249981 RepID=UPI00119A4CC8|nr:DUF2604 domain-containing protein [Gillisia sp. Hel_I_86]TVZ26100.1 hypothetical protein JM83_1047 [Gillisia sp. Hel_I_86]